MLKNIALASVLVAAPIAAQAQEDLLPAQPPSVEALETLLAKHDVAGLSYAELEKCNVKNVRTAGLANISDSTPVAPNTLFEAASLSKPVFAWIVMDLARNGVVDLDRPFADYAFDWPRISDKDNYAKLTPRLVLSHRTGLPNWVGNSLNPDRTDMIAFRTEPDTEHTYSGEGFQLLQAFVEHMTGKSLNTLFIERLGHIMPHSGYNADFREGTEISRGYSKASTPDEGDRDMMPNGSVELSAASLATTASDYAAYMGYICSGSGLPAVSYAEMLSPQTPPRTTDYGLPIRWAIGWSLIDVSGRNLVVHTGNNGQYRAFAGFYPDSGDGFVMLANGAQGTTMISDFLGLLPEPETAESQE